MVAPNRSGPFAALVPWDGEPEFILRFTDGMTTTMFRDVLIGLDHSPAATRALAEAIALADRDGGRLTILTAVAQVQGWPAGPVESVSAARQLNAELEEQAVALQQRAVALVPPCLPVTTVLRHGSPCAALLARIEQGHHDLLVLGDDGARRLRLGRGLTRRLLRRAPVPVLVVGAGGATALQPPERAEQRPRADRPLPIVAENGNAG
jgi:nucleotide-binding universal stress UspA family protein